MTEQNLIPAWKFWWLVSPSQPLSPSHQTRILFGVFLSLHFFSRYLTVRFSTVSGVWCGTIRMENLPIT